MFVGRAWVVVGFGESPRSLAWDEPLLAPGSPLDAELVSVRSNGRVVGPRIVPLGDVQLVEVAVGADGETELAYEPRRSEAGAAGLRLTVEGRTGTTLIMTLVTDRTPGRVTGATPAGETLSVDFAGAGDAEGRVREEVMVGMEQWDGPGARVHPPIGTVTRTPPAPTLTVAAERWRWR